MLAALAGAGLAALLYRSYGRQRRLESSLESARRDLERLQNAFHRFAPQEVVEEIISRGVQVHGERREVTVLFADIIGFTSLSERLEPETLVRMLNGYFAAMTKAIASRRGHVSKFIGDGLMALFGAPDPNPWQASDAVEAALAMRAALKDYNAELAKAGLPELRVGVGIHSGPLVAGVIGSETLMEYTVIGDVVNVASRVEGLTRTLAGDILVSASVQERLGPRFAVRALGETAVKGKSGKIRTYAVDGVSD